MNDRINSPYFDFSEARVAELAHADARRALQEDAGGGDLTAGLVPEHCPATARVRVREAAVLCGAGKQRTSGAHLSLV